MKGQVHWSKPDRDGVRTQIVDVGAASTLRGRRLRRAEPPRIDACALWPTEWREILAVWLKPDSGRRKWSTLLAAAGPTRVTQALALHAELLKAGLVTVDENRERGHWETVWVEFNDPDRLRGALGLPNPARNRVEWKRESRHPIVNPCLKGARQALDSQPPVRALRLLKLLRALDDWVDDRRCGTRRDFALSATGETKGVKPSDWDWLSTHIDLPVLGVQRHTPALWLRAPLVLIQSAKAIDLRAVPDCIALTPQTIRNLDTVSGNIDCWRVVENRTSFEKIARRFGDHDGVLWVPGFAPRWWLKSVAALIDLRPAPALIACDPDPAGIDIALGVAELWTQREMAWRPWAMDAATLARARHRPPLTEHDQARLRVQLKQSLPDTFKELAEWMLQHNAKGEQEGIVLA